MQTVEDARNVNIHRDLRKRTLSGDSDHLRTPAGGNPRQNPPQSADGVREITPPALVNESQVTPIVERSRYLWRQRRIACESTGAPASGSSRRVVSQALPRRSLPCAV